MDRDIQHERLRYRSYGLPNGGTAERWFTRRDGRVGMSSSMNSAKSSGSGSSFWTACAKENCLGEAIQGAETCFVHSTPDQRRIYIIASRNAQNKGALSLRGNQITATIWNEVYPQLLNGNQLVTAISFAGAEISTPIEFGDIIFQYFIDFDGADILQYCRAHQCTFKGTFTANYVLFNKGGFHFTECELQQDARITFPEIRAVTVSFERCIFRKGLAVDGFDGPVHLTGSRVHGNASFKLAKGQLHASNCEFFESIDFDEVDCEAFFGERLVAHSATRIGPCVIRSTILPRATFKSRIQIELKSDSIELFGSSFEEGGLLVAEQAKIQLAQVSLGGPLRVAASTDAIDRPEVLTLHNSDAGQMIFSRVNLTRCSFQGAHGLEAIDIESNCEFSRAPLWAGRRRFIADEYAWRKRAGRIHNFKWEIRGVHIGNEHPKLPRHARTKPILIQPQSALQVSALYRDLRRSLESKSDMPGAADFYYGEMEMRRWGKGKRISERILVSSYWFACGYGLRPGRAVLVWLVVTALGAIAFMRMGMSLDRSLLSAIRAMVPGMPTGQTTDTAIQSLETVLRIIGAILSALVLISARSLVMRKPSE